MFLKEKIVFLGPVQGNGTQFPSTSHSRPQSFKLPQPSGGLKKKVIAPTSQLLNSISSKCYNVMKSGDLGRSFTIVFVITLSLVGFLSGAKSMNLRFLKYALPAQEPFST
jgi:hypothetical protein